MCIPICVKIHVRIHTYVDLYSKKTERIRQTDESLSCEKSMNEKVGVKDRSLWFFTLNITVLL